ARWQSADHSGSTSAGNTALGYPPQGRSGGGGSRWIVESRGSVRPIYLDGRGISELAAFDRQAWSGGLENDAYSAVSAVTPLFVSEFERAGGQNLRPFA